MTEPRYFAAIPEGLTLYRSAHDYIAEDPSRQSGMGVDGDIGGWDVADGFRLAETTMAGSPDSEWRISVVRRTVYAVLRRFPGDDLYTFDGPVWIIDEIPEYLSVSVLVPNTVGKIMRSVEQLRAEPESLLLAVGMIQTMLEIVREAESELTRFRMGRASGLRTQLP